MKKTVQLSETPIGYCASAVYGGPVQVEFRGWSLSSSGREFIRKVEGFPNQLLQLAGPEWTPASVNRLVAIIRQDLSVDLFINDIEAQAEAFVARSVKFGEGVTKSDIYHFDKVIFDGISFPEDCGYVVLINNGWDRILYWDFGPLLQDGDKRMIDYEVSRFIAAGYSASIFNELFDISEDDWATIIESGWFPFTMLGYERQKKLMTHLRLGWDTTAIEDEIEQLLREGSVEWLEGLQQNPKINNHYSFIEKTLRYHLNQDYDASIHILYPRIEALLREDFIRANPALEGRRQAVLASHIPTNVVNNTHSVSRLFPHKFGEYLSKHFFKDFDVRQETDHLGRNTLTHGVVPQSSLTRKASIIGFLIIDQVHRYTYLSTACEIRGMQQT